MNKLKLKCECPDTGETPSEREYQYAEEEKSGMNHKPNECKGTNKIKLYNRNGKALFLCSCCNMFGDKEVTSKSDTSEVKTKKKVVKKGLKQGRIF